MFTIIEKHPVDLDELKGKLQSLEKDVSEIVEMLQKNQISKDDLMKKHLSNESLSLIQSLLLLLI
ncbi:hypothetical protein [Peribacillus alkalitolerans]|uniref:hypothetical protein n=1 Tax=Peribacillus alkalitolerans TaxID=1550385 RepID=UPI001F085C32|nr:hypothetical protein [Peribacillus alkalitolerans]